ncbi:MAG: polyprenyl synthetase family protein [Nitrososphaerota archaeon]|nr:polyprenyl synthetase family protein [Nitrososphaerota archaeon]
MDYAPMLEEMKRVKTRVDGLILDELLPKSHPQREVDLLYRMMRDYPERGGKGMRPFLCVTSCRAFGGDEDEVILTAASLELFQNWILIHDDIEDGSEMRRGSPSLHRKYDWTLALNAGDALHARMWQALLGNKDTLGEARTLAVMGEFAHMIDETTEGQQMELGWVVAKNWQLTEDDYRTMCTKKTSWYTAISPMRLGGIAAGADPDKLAPLVEAGTKLGVGFQIHDDVLNISGGQKYGKQSADDLLEGKRTLILIRLLASLNKDEKKRFVELFNMPRVERRLHIDELIALIEKYRVLDYASERSQELVSQAISVLRKVRWGGDAQAARWIEELSTFAVERDW